MSNDTEPGEGRNDRSTDSQGPQQHVVHVDGIRATFEEDIVSAARLIEVSQDNPQNFDLVALRGEGGGDERIFDHTEDVNLTEQHRDHFDTKGDGQNYV